MKASFWNLFNYYSKYKEIAILSIAAASLFEIIELAIPYAIGQILNVISNQPIDQIISRITEYLSNFTGGEINSQDLSLGILLGIIALATVVKAPIKPWLSDWFHWKIPLDSRRDNYEKVIVKILTLPLGFYEENNPGRIAGKINRGVENHVWVYVEIASQLVPKLMRILGIFIIILLIEWWIAVIFLITFILILWHLIGGLQDLVKEEGKLDLYRENTESRLSEIITNIKTVKAFTSESREFARLKKRLNRHSNVLINRLHLGYVKLATWEQSVMQISVFAILVLTLIPTLNGEISLGHFVTTLTISSMAYAELDPITEVSESVARRYASMIRLNHFMKLPAGEDAASLVPEYLPANPYKFTGKIELNNISFGYDSQRLVLEDINLVIEPYQTVAFVGHSGSGKSTLVKLLFRYFEPTKGKILMDGDNIKTLDITRYRKRLAIVHQDVDIFNGTILDNLVYGNPTVSLDQVKEACKIAKVDEFIHLLPQGYQTIVGERGVRLSGGQKQRLGIARALIVNPDILIFDEATSSLDYESERYIQLAMRSIFGTRTTLIIAHRLSTIREADKIVVLDSGKIIEVGSHDELLNHQGIYHRLHHLQETGDLL